MVTSILSNTNNSIICLLLDDSGLTYSISLVNSCKCTVQKTEHTGRELPPG